ncbi:MAG: PLDc N-terminal domain-containing protein, partial [Lactobacillus iners]|nr:PLDc N-terminal domain-containing protein [Lactobacillus iners]
MANIITLILIVNMIISFYIVFRHQRSVATSWAWLIILLIFPVAGFIIYGFIGRGISKENL